MKNFKLLKKGKEEYTEVKEIEEIKFYPKGKDFYFNFTKDTCEKIRTGVCNIEKIVQYKHDIEKFEKHCNGSKCSNLALSLLKNGLYRASYSPLYNF